MLFNCFIKNIVNIVAAAVFSWGSLILPFDGFNGFIQKFYERFFPTQQAQTQITQSTIVFEAETGTVLSSENENEVMQAGHLAKLMTLLIVEETLENGDISLDTQISVSQYANSMQGSQVWLDVGEKISVEELIKSITVGNANDACVALAEAVAKTEQDFASLMNEKAASIGMKNTFYADCTGISADTKTTAYDTALLCAELSKHEDVFKYTTTWMDDVRGGKAQLVNLNRMVRTYKGIIGFKACYSEGCRNCLAAAAQRGNMTVVAVIIGSPDEDSRFSWAKDAMNKAFAAYEIYVPEMSEGILDDVNVSFGEKQFASVRCSDDSTVLIPKGCSDDVEVSFERVDNVTAPVKKGTVIGSVCFTLSGEEIYFADICLSEDVDRLSFGESFKRILLELLKM